MLYISTVSLTSRNPREKKKWPGGRRNPLKWLVSDKEIQKFEAFSLIVFAPLCPGFAGFC